MAMSVKDWEDFFKPEVRSAGENLIKKQNVFLQRSVDTQVDAYVKATTPTRISFKADSIESASFTADCNCSSSRKGQLCKHIWAVLSMLIKKSSDFLENKRSLDKLSSENGAGEKPVKEKKPLSQSQLDYQAKQAEYRKQAYQTQKERARARNLKKKSAGKTKSKSSSKHDLNLPADVLEAIRYFEENGFTMSPPFDEESINNAKRSLSRIFHPDKGGSHEEIVVLLKHSNVLLNYKGSF